MTWVNFLSSFNSSPTIRTTDQPQFLLTGGSMPITVIGSVGVFQIGSCCASAKFSTEVVPYAVPIAHVGDVQPVGNDEPRLAVLSVRREEHEGGLGAVTDRT